MCARAREREGKHESGKPRRLRKSESARKSPASLKNLREKNMPIKYLVFTFLLANMKLPSHTPCLNVLCAVPSLPFSSIPPFALLLPTAEQHKHGVRSGPLSWISALDAQHPPASARCRHRCPCCCPPFLGRAQRRVGPSPVSSCVPDPASSLQPHAQDEKKNHARCSACSFIVERRA